MPPSRSRFGGVDTDYFHVNAPNSSPDNDGLDFEKQQLFLDHWASVFKLNSGWAVLLAVQRSDAHLAMQRQRDLIYAASQRTFEMQSEEARNHRHVFISCLH